MNDDFDQLLDTAFKALPEIAAPPNLMRNVMRRIDQPSSLSWAKWPVAWRVAFLFLAAVLIVYAGCCQPSLSRLAGVAWAKWHFHTAWISDAAATLLGAAVVAFEHLGKFFLLVTTVVALLSYLACVGLGTAIYQFAIQRTNRTL